LDKGLVMCLHIVLGWKIAYYTEGS